MNASQAICREREVLRRQHKALSTEDCYIFWLRRYMTALREMPEGLSSEKKLEPDVLFHHMAKSSATLPFLEFFAYVTNKTLKQATTDPAYVHAPG